MELVNGKRRALTCVGFSLFWMVLCFDSIASVKLFNHVEWTFDRILVSSPEQLTSSMAVCAYDEFDVHVLFGLPKTLPRSEKVKLQFGLRLWRQDSSTAHEEQGIDILEEDPSNKLITWKKLVVHAQAQQQQQQNADQDQDQDQDQDNHEHAQDRVSPLLQCALDAEFCVPQIVSIRLPDHHDDHDRLQVNETLVIRFDQDTNEPFLPTKTAIDQVLRFVVYLADEMHAKWHTPRQLTIQLTEINGSKQDSMQETMRKLQLTTLQSFQDGSDAQEQEEGQDREQEDEYNESNTKAYTGTLRFRIGLPGVYKFELVTQRYQVITDRSISPAFRIGSCSDAVVVTHDSPLVGQAEDSGVTNAWAVGQQQRQHPPRDDTLSASFAMAPSFAFRGVLSHAGHQGFAIPNNTILMQQIGTWSLSFWAFVTEDSTGNFRTLFFKGDGTSSHRTPSVWLLPHQRKVALRVSSTVGMDIGIDSKSEIAINEWVHLAFVFRNCSTGTNASTAKVLEDVDGCPSRAAMENGERPWYFAFHFYLNGLLDRQMLVFAPVFGNDGALQIGKAPGLDGFRGFISSLAIFPSALSEQRIRQMFVDESRHHDNFFRQAASLNSVLREISHLDYKQWTVTRQISFLGQILPRIRPRDRLHQPIEEEEEEEEEVQSALAPSSTDSHAPSDQDDLEAQYQQAIQLLEQCDIRGFDILRESAEFGLPKALRDLGQALLFGDYLGGMNDSICASPGVMQLPLDLTQAESLLVRAFVSGQTDAAKPLALLKSMTLDAEIDAVLEELDEEAMVLQLLSHCIDGLYHFAAASGRLDAFAVLGRKYQHGASAIGAAGVPKDQEIASYYFLYAAIESSRAYHAHGKQPLIEMNDLYGAKEDEISKGQLGDEDELIQFQKMRADKDGDVEAMAAMGDLYYWGARGVQRDHTQAVHYFERAAQAGHVSSMAALAGMLLKGEGASQDNQSALHWYEKAAKKNHTRALNGLGFAYFHGTGGLQQNKTKALEFFERAAANQEDGDSVFNAGYCHAMGLGTVANLTRAMYFYETAARRFGHFDAVFELGKIWLQGIDTNESWIARNPQQALVYLKAASDAGPWAKRMRQGFNKFLAKDFDRAIMLYHDALEFGYEIAKSNLAFLYDRKRVPYSHNIQDQKRALQFLTQAATTNHEKQAMTRIGDYHLLGLAGLQRDPQQALRWYSRASANGDPVGAFNAGQLYETGGHGRVIARDLNRAERYYQRVLELSSSTETYVAVQLALARLWLLQFAPEWLSGWTWQRPLEEEDDKEDELHHPRSGGSILERIVEQLESSSWFPMIFFVTASLGYIGVLFLNRHNHEVPIIQQERDEAPAVAPVAAM